MTTAISTEVNWSVAVPDSGLSDDAHKVRALNRDTPDLFPDVALSWRKHKLITELLEAFRDAREEGWDGYEADPADSASVSYAIQFLSQLPMAYMSPDVAIDADGKVAVEWDYGPRQVLSIRIGRDGTMYYAGLVGHRSFHGVEYFLGGIPDDITRGISKVGRAATFLS